MLVHGLRPIIRRRRSDVHRMTQPLRSGSGTAAARIKPQIPGLPTRRLRIAPTVARSIQVRGIPGRQPIAHRKTRAARRRASARPPRADLQIAQPPRRATEHQAFSGQRYDRLSHERRIGRYNQDPRLPHVREDQERRPQPAPVHREHRRPLAAHRSGPSRLHAVRHPLKVHHKGPPRLDAARLPLKAHRSGPPRLHAVRRRAYRPLPLRHRDEPATVAGPRAHREVTQDPASHGADLLGRATAISKK